MKFDTIVSNKCFRSNVPSHLISSKRDTNDDRFWIHKLIMVSKTTNRTGKVNDPKERSEQHLPLNENEIMKTILNYISTFLNSIVCL